MKKNIETAFRSELEKLPTSQLDAMLQEALRREPVEEDTVRLILSVLEDRDEETDEDPGPEAAEAWEAYLENTENVLPEPPRRGKWVIRAASVVVVASVLFVLLPQEASARVFFDRIICWTEEFFEQLSPNDNRTPEEYVFTTDDPGLQQLYDAVTELGVTQPVVPMWIPEGYTLTECKAHSALSEKSVFGFFVNGTSGLGFRVVVYDENISSRYYKGEEDVTQFEKNGIVHNIMRNDNSWVVVWVRENIECSITIDCQEDELYKMIRSIYSMEDIE